MGNVSVMRDRRESEECRRAETLLPAFYRTLEVGNPDTIYHVMLKMRYSMTPERFLTSIRNFPMALNLYKKYCKEFNQQALFEIYVQEKNLDNQAIIFVEASLKSDSTDFFLISARETFKNINPVNSSLCEEQLHLLDYQRKLNEKKTDCNFIGRTVHETCLLLLKSDPKMAEDFRNEFNIPERRFFWLRMRSLADLGEWGKLHKLSKMKNCPIKAEAFVDLCLEKDKKEEAVRYLGKVRQKLKVRYLIKAGRLEEAAEQAFRLNDVENLQSVKAVCEYRSDLFHRVNSYIKGLDSANYQMIRTFNL